MADAVALVRSGQTVVIGGFGVTGYPTRLLNALAETEVDNLTCISNNVGEPGIGGGMLLRRGKIRKAIGSFFTSNREAVEAHLAGNLEVQLIPQGDLAEALRAGGAGIGGFTPPQARGRNWRPVAKYASSTVPPWSSSGPCAVTFP